MAQAHGFGWFGLRAARRRGESQLRAPIMASRDLPPLPRSPEPLPEEALVFARGAATRTVQPVPSDADEHCAPLSIIEGADLRAMLNKVLEASHRRDARDQAAQARARIVERLSAGKAGMGDKATLQLVDGQTLSSARGAGDHAARIDEAMQEALTSALGTLRQLSALAKG